MVTLPLPESDNETTALMHRRHVIGTLGLVGVGMVATAGDAFAAPKVSVPTAASSSMGATPAMRYQAGRSPLAEVSRDWARVHGAQANEYLRYLNGLRFRKINPEQVIAAHAKQRRDVWNSLPPKQWWNRMGYVLRVVDRVAMEMNLDRVEVVSAYRTPAYNAYCGGRSRSWHQANVAVDIKTPVSAYRFTKTARQLRDEGLFRGGVGSYPGFTHIDARGQNINW